MQIRKLRIKNFRSIAEGEILFSNHSVLIGGNSVGKSTVCEALDLLLGPDRLSKSSPIDEHDFHARQYLDDDNEPIPIEIEGVLTGLTPDLERQYRNNIEFWDVEVEDLLDETAEVEDVDVETVIPALRIAFRGVYDPDEDEFAAEVYFASPPVKDEGRRPRVTRADKRRLGFVYLRALRTGTRALSLERGSLLDIILRLKDDDRSTMWEQTLQSLENLRPPIHDIPQLQSVLDEIDKRVRRFVGLSRDQQSLGLFPSALTRESLRRSITLFGASELSETLVPYWRLGSGVINAMVFSLLTFMAELKQNVIFAMEEPEIAIPPHTQRRIVQFLRASVDQTILTSHSPFILEQFPPESVILLSRDSDNQLEGTRLELTGIKAKTYRGGLRRHFAEAMLGRGVVCVEGVSDGEMLQMASALLESESDVNDPYTPLDLSGVTVVQCDGDGSLSRHGEFFNSLGLKTYCFFDKQRNVANVDEIESTFDRCWELESTGIERLLSDEVPAEVLRNFLEAATERDDYPFGPAFEYDLDADDAAVRNVCFKVLRVRKGAGYAGNLVELCAKGDIPAILVEALLEVSNDLPNQFPVTDEAEEAEAAADDE